MTNNSSWKAIVRQQILVGAKATNKAGMLLAIIK